MGRGNEPETCTVELSTGSFVHLACPPSVVALARQSAYNAGRACSSLWPFERVVSSVVRWEAVLIDVTQVVAVYAVTERPEKAATIAPYDPRASA